ncbi:hypothetical protein HU200_043012 [Digitaria exilis]|uniref:Reverse transcriptase zinc-binding domain-containing protein n=1 Tax=Digitaria exilis TaxID=1010633 RepID=A0A835BA17_9POAL|nr:hypothetical protein HU200_043012 [Digitaria exilis]
MAPFSSSGFYSTKMAERPVDPFAMEIWKNAATPRCKHFLWLVHHHRLPSAALLHHRCILDSPLCAYYSATEDQDHLLLRCPRARRVWRMIGWETAPFLQMFRDLWQMPELPDGDPRARSAVVTAILWNIWKCRNAFVFRGVANTADTVIKEDLTLWTSRLPQHATAAIMEFCNSTVT